MTQPQPPPHTAAPRTHHRWRRSLAIMGYAAISCAPCPQGIPHTTDCIVVIEHGEVMEKGSHEELLALKGRYYQLYTGQFELD